MENDALSSLDPDSYERIYVCHICNGISMEPVCSNDHTTRDFENFIEGTMLNNYNKLVFGRKSKQAKICAVIPRIVKTDCEPQEDQPAYLCPACGDFSPDAECTKSHDVKALKDICNMCGTEFVSLKEMMQHRTCCSVAFKHVVGSNIVTTIPSCSTQMFNVQPVDFCLPENFASMVQKGTLGIGQYQVMAASMDTDRKEENVYIVSDGDYDLDQKVLEWDESIDLAVLDVEDSTYEVLKSDENLKESKIADTAQIEPSKCNQLSSSTVINRKSMGHKMPGNRRQLCCVTCKKEFSDVHTLAAHYLSQHGSYTFICQFCMRHYTREHWFKTHMNNHVNELPIVCPLCDDSFLSDKLHEDHLQMVHNLAVSDLDKLPNSQKNAFMCMECGRWLKSEKHLESHRKMHAMVKGRTVPRKNQILTGGSSRRASSSAVSTNTNLLKLGNRKPVHVFECNICLATIKSIEEVRLHMMTHDAHRLNKCESCNERFPTTAQLQQHKCVRYDSNMNACTVCSKVFSNAAGLSCHLKTDHQVETIPCDKCQLKFKGLSTYLIHRARHH